MRTVCVAAWLLLVAAPPARAGLHYAGEPTRESPARWRGFLPDHRLLRQLALPAGVNTPPLRDTYADARLRLEAAAKSRPLSADDAADLGAVLVRLGHPADAVAVLRPAARAHPDHFRLAANLGTAWQAAGDLSQSADALADAVRLAPAEWKPAEELHLKLVRRRAALPPRSPVALDDLFGVNFDAATPGKLPAAEAAKLPADALAVAQRLAVWLPADGRLLWQLGELANATGDVRTAAAVLDGCVTEFGLDAPGLRARRQQYRAAADALDKAGTATAGTAAFKSPRVLVRTADPARLPAVERGGVTPLSWAAVADVEFDRGRWQVPAYLAGFDGERAAVTGYITPAGGAPAAGGLTTFLFTENPVGCWFCDAPGPAQAVVVELAAGTEAEPTRQAVRLVGTVRVNRADAEAYPVRLTNAAVAAAD